MESAGCFLSICLNMKKKEGWNMKKTFKKLTCIILTAIMVCTTMAFTVSAASGPSYSKRQTVYMTSKNSNSSYTSIYVGNLTSSQKISKSSVKSSKSAVLAPYSLYRNTYSYENQYFESGMKGNKGSGYSYSIELRAKKAGSANISFKIGSKKYTSKVTVKAYTNPISSLTVTGVKNGSSSNLAGKFKNKNYSSLKLSKNVKKATVTCKAASGWKIVRIGTFDENNKLQRSISTRNEGASVLSLHAGNLTKNHINEITVDLVNTKTGGSLSCTMYLS